MLGTRIEEVCPLAPPHLRIFTLDISTSPLPFVLGPSFPASSAFSTSFSHTRALLFLASLLFPRVHTTHVIFPGDTHKDINSLRAFGRSSIHLQTLARGSGVRQPPRWVSHAAGPLVDAQYHLQRCLIRVNSVMGAKVTSWNEIAQ